MQSSTEQPVTQQQEGNLKYQDVRVSESVIHHKTDSSQDLLALAQAPAVSSLGGAQRPPNLPWPVGFISISP